MPRPYSYPLSPDLIRHVTETLGDAGREWIVELPMLINELSTMWSLEVGEPFLAGEFNFVAPALRHQNEAVVLKICPPFENGEFLSECKWLRYRDGRGAIRLVEVDRYSHAMLLERAVPGRSLAEGFQGNEPAIVSHALEVLAAIRMPEPSDGADAIVLANWFKNLERAGGTDFPSEYAEKALYFYSELSAKEPPAYLHGDFHPGNIVTATRSAHLAIDPKGIIGPLGYDVAVFLNNLYWGQGNEIDHAEVKAVLWECVGKFSAAVGISEWDLRRWAFAVSVLGAWWTFDEMPAIYSGGVAKADIWDV